jgi:phosphatidylserine decarboxylase
MLHFHKEGAKSILFASFVTFVIVVAANHFLKEHYWVMKGIQVLALLLLIIVLRFFRNPNRSIRAQKHTIVAPVDGKVVSIKEVIENEYFKDKRLQISIFVSPVNVHVVRYPISGKVNFSSNYPHKSTVVSRKRSNDQMERTTIVLESEAFGEILYQQIAGSLAKRIVNYAKLGEEVTQGDDAGFIKFGSRVDLFLPVGTKLNVRLNDKIKGNQSIIVGKI